MLTDRYIPTRLVVAAGDQTNTVFPPKDVPRFRPVMVVLTIIELISRFLWSLLTKRGDVAKFAGWLRGKLEQLGATWIRAGQMLSLRGDLFSTEFCAELAKIRDAGPAIPFHEVRDIMEDELHAPLSRLFEEFEPTPFAVSSVAQIHRAYLRPQKVWVAVKVQKSNARQYFEQDMVILRWTVRVLQRVSRLPNVHWDDFVKQLDAQIAKELDFRYERSALQRFKVNLRQHSIYVPETFPTYCTRHILVMEFIHGALMSDVITAHQQSPERLVDWLKTNDIGLRHVARHLFNSVYRQIFEDNFFHSDLRPGNIVLLRHNRLALIDCRSVGSLEGEFLERYRRFLQALLHQQYAVAADLYFLLADSLPVVEIADVKAELIRTWRVWETETHIRKLPYDEKSMTAMFTHINRLLFTYRFSVQWPLSKLAGTWANLDASLMHLIPNMNYLTYLRRYWQNVQRRSDKRERKNLRRRLSVSIAAAQELPQQVSEYALVQQRILRRQAQVLQGKTTKIGEVIAAFLKWIEFPLFAGTLLLCGAFTAQYFESGIKGILGAQLSALIDMLPSFGVGAWMGILGCGIGPLLIVRKVRKHFEKIDVLLPNIQISV
ncbi:MAG: AarF/ABC1/UbiB kinase family protein [bacterium]|nr:AarF/ABC1/UbiB kinase family protein [bacterium]